MSSVETIARRYAAALADVVAKGGDVETIKSELTAWETMIRTNADLANAFGNPSIAHARKEAVLESLLNKTKPSRPTANFLRVLLQNGRLTELSAINEKFVSVLEERNGILHGRVISAHDLSDAERTELTANLEKVTGKHVKLDYEIDKGLIGGVVTRVGSTVYDGSVRTQLENLREQLVNG